MAASGWSRRGVSAALLSAPLAPAAARADAGAPPSRRIVAVGDLHGDFPAWRAILQAAGLTDAAGRWTGGHATLVQAGDVVDRGPDGRKLMFDLMRLQREAARAGGRVVALVGNHEAMNMTGDLRYVSATDFAAYATPESARLREQAYETRGAQIEAAARKRDPTLSAGDARRAWYASHPLGRLEHDAAWAPDGAIGRWVVANPAVALLDGTLFVHGGLSTEYAKLPLDEINARVAAALKARDAAPTAIINDPLGPLWYRGLALGRAAALDAEGGVADLGAEARSAGSIEDELAGVLKAYGAQRMVIAHTPTLNGVMVLYGGRLIRIDTGISAVFRGTLTYLDLADGAATPHVVPRPPASGGSR